MQDLDYEITLRICKVRNKFCHRFVDPSVCKWSIITNDSSSLEYQPVVIVTVVETVVEISRDHCKLGVTFTK